MSEDVPRRTPERRRGSVNISDRAEALAAFQVIGNRRRMIYFRFKSEITNSCICNNFDIHLFSMSRQMRPCAPKRKGEAPDPGRPAQLSERPAHRGIFLALGALATADMAAALGFFAATFSFWKLSHTVSWRDLLFSMLARSGLVLAKMSAVLVLPIFFFILTVRFFSRRPIEFQLFTNKILGHRFARAGILELSGRSPFARRHGNPLAGVQFSILQLE